MSKMEMAFEAFLNGARTADAAATAGVNRHSFHQWIHKTGRGKQKWAKLRLDAEEVITAWAAFIREAVDRDVFDRTRRQDIAYLRQALIAAAYRDGHSFPLIASVFGMDHTTCLHAVQVVGECDLRSELAAAIQFQDAGRLASAFAPFEQESAAKAAHAERQQARQARNNAIVEAFASGRRTAEIAAEYGVTAQQIRKIAKDCGLQRGYRTLSDADKAAIERMASAGQTSREIGFTIGFNESTVSAYRRKMGLAPPSVTMVRWSKKDTQTLKKLASTHSAAQIGKILGRSRNSVIGRADRLGISLS